MAGYYGWNDPNPQPMPMAYGSSENHYPARQMHAGSWSTGTWGNDGGNAQYPQGSAYAGTDFQAVL